MVFFDEYITQANKYYNRTAAVGIRVGQAYFNVLMDYKPQLAEEVRGTELDPFQSNNSNDTRFKDFINFVNNNWNKYDQ